MGTSTRARWVVVSFVIGIIIGGLGGALFVTTKVAQAEADALTVAIADSAFGLVPLVSALHDGEPDEQIDLVSSAAEKQLNASIIVMDSNLSILSEDNRELVERVLESISRKREKLRLGRFSNPRRDDIEKILVAYSE